MFQKESPTDIALVTIVIRNYLSENQKSRLTDFLFNVEYVSFIDITCLR